MCPRKTKSKQTLNQAFCSNSKKKQHKHGNNQLKNEEVSISIHTSFFKEVNLVFSCQLRTIKCKR